ncbi:MAG: ATP-binding protein [Hyphomonadaceae bacterium]
MKVFTGRDWRWALPWSAGIVLCLVMLVAGALAGTLWITDRAAEQLIAQQEAQSAESELDLLVRIEKDEGIAGLERNIARRLAVQTGPQRKLYALRTADGRLVAGNLRAWPAALTDDEAWRRVGGQNEDDAIHAATRALDGGAALLVGRDAAVVVSLQNQIVSAVWLSVAFATIACLAVAILIVAFVMARVRRLSSVAERVAGGDFSARAANDGEVGPFGDIARAQNAMLERIEDLVIGLTTVTDSLAHDLRTPLARTRRLLEDGVIKADPAAKQTALESALAEMDRTIATFGSLIDIARAQGGLSREAMESLDLGRIVGDVGDLFAPLADDFGVALNVEIKATKPLLGHRALLQQAVSNLVHNAIKHSPPGGRVEVTLNQTGENVEIVVRDTGPGIAADERDEVLKRFRKGAKAGADGLGLGLAIADACARLHRGRLALEDNTPGVCARLSLVG